MNMKLEHEIQPPVGLKLCFTSLRAASGGTKSPILKTARAGVTSTTSSIGISRNAKQTAGSDVPVVPDAQCSDCSNVHWKALVLPLQSFLSSKDSARNGTVGVRVSSSIFVGTSWSLFHSCMRSEGSSFTLGVWGWGRVRQKLRLCPQPFATVRNRSQPFATVRNCLREGRKALHSGECCWKGSRKWVKWTCDIAVILAFAEEVSVWVIFSLNKRVSIRLRGLHLVSCFLVRCLWRWKTDFRWSAQSLPWAQSPLVLIPTRGPLQYPFVAPGKWKSNFNIMKHGDWTTTMMFDSFLNKTCIFKMIFSTRTWSTKWCQDTAHGATFGCATNQDRHTQKLGAPLWSSKINKISIIFYPYIYIHKYSHIYITYHNMHKYPWISVYVSNTFHHIFLQVWLGHFKWPELVLGWNLFFRHHDTNRFALGLPRKLAQGYLQFWGWLLTSHFDLTMRHLKPCATWRKLKATWL